MKKIAAFIVITCFAAGVVLAADDNGGNDTTKKNSDSRTRFRHRVPAAAERGQASRNQLFAKARANRFDQHQKEIAELDAIKKIAQEEGATRTVDAIQKLIDAKNEAFKKAAVERENLLKRRAAQMRNHQAAAGEKNAAEKTDNKAQKDTDAK